MCEKMKDPINYIDRRMAAVEAIMQQQKAEECRKNVWETVNGLKENFPDNVDYIDSIYNKLVKKYDIDFFECIRNLSMILKEANAI